MLAEKNLKTTRMYQIDFKNRCKIELKDITDGVIIDFFEGGLERVEEGIEEVEEEIEEVEEEIKKYDKKMEMNKEEIQKYEKRIKK